MSAACEVHSMTVPASPFDVARALRSIADHIEREDLCLIGLWSTGFGEPVDAVIQYVVERDEGPQP